MISSELWAASRVRDAVSNLVDIGSAISACERSADTSSTSEVPGLAISIWCGQLASLVLNTQTLLVGSGSKYEIVLAGSP